MNFWRRLQYWRSAEAEMQEELRSLQELAGPRELGNLTYAAEAARAQWRWIWLDNFWGDLRYAVRVLARQPSFTAVAILSLALGIGANAAIFSLVDRVLWRQLPVREPERLVSIEGAGSYFAWQQYNAKGAEAFAGVLATSGVEERVIDAGAEGRTGRVELVSGNYFPILGVPPFLGRTILPEDDTRGQPQAVAVLSYRYWQSEFGGDPAVLGRQIRVAKIPFLIVGVARPEFFGVSVGRTADMWLPLATLGQVFSGRTWLDRPSVNFLSLVARLRPEVTPERAAAMLTPLAVSIDIERAGKGLPEWIRKRIEAGQLKLNPAVQGIGSLRLRFSTPLHVLFTMVGIVLLLACINVMGLQFARTDERRREVNIRLAIGASRWRLVRQLFTESLMVAVAGGLLGLAIYRPAAMAIVSLVTLAGQPVNLPLDLDIRALLFVVAISLAAALISGILPALRATRERTGERLHQNTKSASAGPVRHALGRVVTAVQLALSVVLISGAFLFASSLYQLTNFETGIDRRNLIMVDVDMTEAGYKLSQKVNLDQRLYERFKTMKNVEAVSFSSYGVYTGRSSNGQTGADGFQAESGAEWNAFDDQVGPGYFTTLHARIVAGRDFTERDNPSGPRVAIVSQEFARHFFPGQDPIGRNIYNMNIKIPMQVVGVVEDIRHNIRQPPRRIYYQPHFQSRMEFPSTRFLLRTQAGAAELRAAVRAEDAAVRVVGIDSAETLLNRTLDLDRLVAMLSFAFGILAVVLAAVGIYGLLAYDVTRRTGEIGIRMALGATRQSVVGLVFSEAVIVAAGGLAAGIPAALALGKFIESLVFQLKPGDPLVLAAAAVLLLLVVLCAGWLPARRAASLDPMNCLRHD